VGFALVDERFGLGDGFADLRLADAEPRELDLVGN